MTQSPSDAVTAVTAAAAPGNPYSANRIPNWTEYLGVYVFFALCLALSVKMIEAIRLGSWGVVALASLGGFVASDFTSGVVHWLFDTWGSPQTPVVGQTFVVPFRVHHLDPIDICRHGFIATNGHNCLVTIPVLVGMLFVDVHGGWGAGVLAFMTALSVGVFATNQFHKWAHEPKVGPVVDFLQRHHLVLNPRHHGTHHTRPYDQSYCITTGWLNPLLRAIRFFRVVEWAITRVTGVEPRKDDLTSA